MVHQKHAPNIGFISIMTRHCTYTQEAKLSNARCVSASSTLLKNRSIKQRGRISHVLLKVELLVHVLLKVEFSQSREKQYASNEGMPRTNLRCLASLIMHEIYELLFRRKESGVESASSRVAQDELIPKENLNDWRLRKN